MKSSRSSFPNKWCYAPLATLCLALALPLNGELLAQQSEPPATSATTEQESPALPNDQLDSLVAPIALYPDHLLGQVLVASTYPLEIMQLDQWMKKNTTLKDKALADAVAKQPWDPSVQGLAAFPEVVTRMSENVSWTSDLGNAFLAQQGDVMSAVQRMRAKAQGKGTLKTSSEQKVETQQVEGKEVIVIEQANPEVVYVPSYDPEVVYGAPAYPYPSYSYPGYVPGMALTLGTGLALGAAWGGSWGWGCGWGDNDININNNNNFNKNNINNINNINRGQGGKWEHNPAHRGNAPYADKRTANKYGGDARNPSNRSASGAGPGNRPGDGAGPGNKPGGGAGPGNRPGDGAGPGNKPGGGAGPGNKPGGGAGPGNKAAGGNKPSAKPSTPRSSAGGDKVGGRSTSPGSNKSAFDSGGGHAAKSASSRGGQSMGGGSRSGGGSKGGGSRGGGSGGGRRR